MLMSFNYRLNYVDASKDSISAFFWCAASRPAGLPRYGCGVPRKAAAGQATATKLQTY